MAHVKLMVNQPCLIPPARGRALSSGNSGNPLCVALLKERRYFVHKGHVVWYAVFVDSN